MIHFQTELFLLFFSYLPIEQNAVEKLHSKSCNLCEQVMVTKTLSWPNPENSVREIFHKGPYKPPSRSNWGPIPKSSNCFSVFLRKPIASCDFPGGEGGLDPLSPLWIRPCWFGQIMIKLTPSFSFSINTFFIATIFFVFLSLALKTSLKNKT